MQIDKNVSRMRRNGRRRRSPYKAISRPTLLKKAIWQGIRICQKNTTNIATSSSIFKSWHNDTVESLLRGWLRSFASSERPEGLSANWPNPITYPERRQGTSSNSTKGE
ncbi:hypothetical protein FRC19_011708 [Serendipita sp. 401]|nr:hypothetical protein FRC19_011708 [Serendipita sp. 401]